MMVRAPIDAPEPMTAKGPTVAVGSIVASLATTATACTPGAAAFAGDSTCAARANVRYGDVLRRMAQGASAASPFMITALALVEASLAAYLGFARKVRSPGPAASMVATRRIS